MKASEASNCSFCWEFTRFCLQSVLEVIFLFQPHQKRGAITIITYSSLFRCSKWKILFVILTVLLTICPSEARSLFSGVRFESHKMKIWVKLKLSHTWGSSKIRKCQLCFFSSSSITAMISKEWNLPLENRNSGLWC